MAKFVLGAGLSNYGVFPYYIDTASLELDDGATTKSATIVDQFGFGFKLSGTGFTYDLDGLSGGTVTKVVFFSEDGDLLTVTGGGYTASKLPTDDVGELLELLLGGNDTIEGSESGDVIITGLNAGNDKIFANGGDDYVLGSSGKNTYDGGEGRDTLNYDSAFLDKKNIVGGAVIDVAKGTATNPWGGKDTFSNFEVYYGSHKNDVFKGSNAGEEFDGNTGNDTYTGGKGNDIFLFYGDAGKDTITDFGKGADVVRIQNLFKTQGLDPDAYDTFAELQSVMVGTKAGVTMDFGNGDILFFKGATIADLTEARFEFADF